METKILKRGFIPLAIFLMLLLSIFSISFSLNVNAVSHFSYGMEDSITGNQVLVSESGFFATETYLPYGIGDVRQGIAYSGEKAYCCIATEYSNITYYYPETSNITGGSRWFYTGSTSGVNIDWFNGSTTIIRIYLHNLTNQLIINGYAGSNYTVNDVFLGYRWIQIGWYLTASDTAVYYWTNTTNDSSISWSLYNGNYERITRSFHGGIGGAWYFDDEKISIGATYEGSPYEPEGDKICPTNLRDYDKVERPYLEMEYPTILDTNVLGFDIFVRTEQYNFITSNLSDYELYINGYYAGFPSAWINYTEQYLILRWVGINVSIDNNTVVFEISQTTHKYQTAWHWYVGIDNYGLRHSHSQSDKFGDGLLYGVRTLGEFAYCFYTGAIEKHINFTFDCDWNISNSIQFNNYFDIHVYSDIACQLYYRVENATGSFVEDGVIGGSFTHWHIRDIWIDQNNGIGTFSFMVVDYDTYWSGSGWQYAFDTEYLFNVSTGITRNHGLEPQHKKVPLNSSTGFRFKAPNGEIVWITVVHEVTGYLLKNDSGLTGTGGWVERYNTLIPNLTGVYGLRLYNSSGEIWQVYNWFSVGIGWMPYRLTIDKSVIALGESVIYEVYYDFLAFEPDSVFLVFECDGFIINRILLPQREYSTDSYQPHYAGHYKAYLEIYGGKFDDFYVPFTVTGEGVLPPSEEIFIWGIPQAYVYAMFGAFITLGFLIIPFALSKGNASNIIYAIFGGIGLGISTIAGFFPLWLPLMITLIMLAILYIEHKKG